MPSIFITGAAGGIGRAVAEKFLAAGWTVGAYDINPVTWSPDVHAGLIDVRGASSWDAALAEFAAVTGGRIDVVNDDVGVILGARVALPYLRPASVAPGAHRPAMGSGHRAGGTDGARPHTGRCRWREPALPGRAEEEKQPFHRVLKKNIKNIKLYNCRPARIGAMNRKKNPFRASLGATPPVLVGRSEVIEDFALALDEGPGFHERVTLVTGTRGIGKTVLLNALEDTAEERSWWVISETATPGFVNRIRDTAYRRMVGHLRETRQKLSSFTLAGYALNWEDGETHHPDTTLRDVLTEFLYLQHQLDERLGQAPVGLLITIDELHYSVSDEVIDFGTVIQHLVRENADIAVAMAGIPAAVKPLLASKEAQNPVTFLRRANRVELGAVSDEDVETGLVKPVEAAGRSWDPQACGAAVAACGGYPFMIQLVGQWSFHYAQGDVIEADAAERGIAKAQRKLGQLVHEPALADLSDVDRTYLAAMARDDGPSRTAEIAERLSVSPQYANQYRRRLMEAEMILPVKTGYVDFELPYMRDYLREHIVNDAFSLVLGEDEQPRLPGL